MRKFWHSSKNRRKVSNQGLEISCGFKVDVTEVAIDENFVGGWYAEVKYQVTRGGEMKVELLGGDEGGLWKVGGGEVSPTPGLQVGEERGIGTFVPSNPC